MKRNLRISQMGNLDIPSNPNQRGAHKPKGKVLDKRNDSNDKGYVHATKGPRGMSTKRVRAALITSEMQNGVTGYSIDRIANELKLAASL